jgi:hypothetical protein
MNDEGETEADIANGEAWVVLIGDLLRRAPPEQRADILAEALSCEQAAAAERKAREGALRWLRLGDLDTPGLRHWNAVMRLKSLVVQVFTRNISNNHSPERAAAILLARHPHGTGSRCLGDYLRCLGDYLPR